MKLSKVAAAVAVVGAGLAVVGTAHAGFYQTNITNIAKEVILTDVETVRLPQISYSFQNPVGNPTQSQGFQIQLILQSGTFPTQPRAHGNGPGNVALVDVNGVVIARTNGVTDPSNPKRLVATFDSNSGSTSLPPTVRLDSVRVIWNAPKTNSILGVPFLGTDPLNDSDELRLNGLASVVYGQTNAVGALAAQSQASATCLSPTVQIFADVRQYPNFINPSIIANESDSVAASEHRALTSVNTGPVAQFSQNLQVAATAVALTSQNYNQQARYFNTNTNPINTPSSNTSPITSPAVAFAQSNLNNNNNNGAPLGTSTPTATVNGVGNNATGSRTTTLAVLSWSRIGTGYDIDTLAIYGGGGGTGGAASVLDTSGTFPDVANDVAYPQNKTSTNTNSINLGLVEGRLAVSVTGRFASTGRLWLSTGACVDSNYAPLGTANTVNGVNYVLGTTAPTFSSGDAGVANLVSPTALTATDAPGTGGQRFLNLCYGVDGNAPIPTSSFSVATRLLKSLDTTTATSHTNGVAGSIRYQEQDNACNTTAQVGTGIRIDVRNYASAARFGTSNPIFSNVRIINNSESVTADIFAQIINADGTYGKWGRLPDLKPREARNFSNAQLEAFLTNNPATTPTGYTGNNLNNPATSSTLSNPAYTGGSSTYTSSTAATSGTGTDRLRIVSTTGSTLRVQSYLTLNGGETFLDTSNAQGVDFEAITAPDQNRAATIDGGLSQDAVNGLNGTFLLPTTNPAVTGSGI